MKVYLASSWRNASQPETVELLRAAGLDVYDFRNPGPGLHGFSWSEIDPNWRAWRVAQFNSALSTAIARRGFRLDQEALDAADACVLLLPSGRSAHMEAAWVASKALPVVVYSPTGEYEPELMYKLFTDRICTDINQVLGELLDPIS